MIAEGARLIEAAKRDYLFKTGKTLANSGTGIPVAKPIGL